MYCPIRTPLCRNVAAAFRPGLGARAAGAVRSRQAAQLIQELSAEDAPGLEVTTNSEIDKILREYVKNSGE